MNIKIAKMFPKAGLFLASFRKACALILAHPLPQKGLLLDKHKVPFGRCSHVDLSYPEQDESFETTWPRKYAFTPTMDKAPTMDKPLRAL